MEMTMNQENNCKQCASIRDRVQKLLEALEFYAEQPQPFIESDLFDFNVEPAVFTGGKRARHALVAWKGEK